MTDQTACVGCGEVPAKHGEGYCDRCWYGPRPEWCPCMPEMDRLRAENERLRQFVHVCDVAGCDGLHRNDLERDCCTECGGFFCEEHIDLAGTCSECQTAGATDEPDAPARIALEDVNYRGGGLMGRRSGASREQEDANG